jgi:tRNA(Ile)-lysidine synthase
MPRRGDLYARWSQEMRRGGLLRAGERVGVAVSGGADSVLLLAFMKQLSRAMGLVISAVHFNHHLRGAESDADESFVRDLASRFEVEFIRGEADVARAAREKKRNLEATARELRYRFFFNLTHRGRLDKLATAHTANDQAETVLLRLLRGTGTRGLAGIYPALDGKIIRPFLGLTRAEVEAELRKRQLTFRTDSSNRDPRLRRNKIRMELLPQLERDFNPDVVSLLSDLAERARDDEEYLEQQARERAAPWRTREGEEERFPVRPLAQFPPALARRVVRQMVEATRGSLLGITHRHLEAILRLARSAQSGRRVVLPGNVEARRDFDWLVIAPLSGAKAGAEYAFAVTPPADISLPSHGIRVHLKIVGAEGAGRAYNHNERVLLDAGKLAGELVLRSWRPGDRYHPLGSRKSLKLKELFRERRIAAGTRAGWPVLECGKEIVWVRGFPAAASVAPAEETRTILVIGEELEEGPGKPR